MQAGEKFEFIKPFQPSDIVSDGHEKLSNEDAAVLSRLLGRFIQDRESNVHTFSVLEESGFIEVFESSYRVNMQDGSYIHILFHGSKTEKGLLDFGISLNEHLDDGVYNGGYAYTCTPDGLRRSRSAPDDDTENGDDGLSKTHFTISDMYHGRDELYSMLLSDDEELKRAAEEQKRLYDQEIQFDEIMHASGYDYLPPYPGELEKVMDLVWDAEPFPLHLKDTI